MATNFYDRLRAYYEAVAAVLRGEADAAAVFPNPGNIGAARERIYAEFLKQHAPSKCNVFLGGYLFDDSGTESKQLDVVVTTDTAPRFNFHNRDGAGPSFSSVEGALGAISIKSTLDRAQLADALLGLASIPETRPLDRRLNPSFRITDYPDWPLKVVYATRGNQPGTLLEQLKEFYETHPHIPPHRRVNVVHVAGSCFIIRRTSEVHIFDHQGREVDLPLESFNVIDGATDIAALTWVLNKLQERASAATHIHYDYNEVMHRLTGAR